MNNNAKTESKYLEQASASFSELAKQFHTEISKCGPTHWANYWQVGCVFDTILDYIYVMNKEKQPISPSISSILTDAKNGYQNGVVGNMAGWYDDWSWYGIASSKAFDPEYISLFGDDLEYFRNCALDTWDIVNNGQYDALMNRIPSDLWKKGNIKKEQYTVRNILHKGAAETWNQIKSQMTDREKKDYKAFTSDSNLAIPRFTGGSWQYDMSTEAFPYGDGACWSNPNPSGQKLGVFQVTLMTSLHLVFACRLMKAAQLKAEGTISGPGVDRLESVTIYKAAADKAFGFLKQWNNIEDGDNSLFKNMGTGTDTSCMVRERMPTYAKNSKSKYPNLEWYSADRYWAGDQGLMLGAMIDYYDTVGQDENDDSGLDQMATNIYDGVINHLIGASNFYQDENVTNPLVWPYIPNSGDDIFSMDPGDYGSGSGIFWRYVLYGCRKNSTFMQHVKNNSKVLKDAGSTVSNWGNSIFLPFNNVASAINAYYLFK